MAKRKVSSFTSDDFKRAMQSICPSDAEADIEMQRLLDRMGGDPEKERKE